MKIAVVGIGAMGLPIARRLAAAPGLEFSVFDVVRPGSTRLDAPARRRRRSPTPPRRGCRVHRSPCGPSRRSGRRRARGGRRGRALRRLQHDRARNHRTDRGSPQTLSAVGVTTVGSP